MKFENHVVWDAEKTEYVRHRIPGMIITDKDTVIVYNEARRDGSDWAVMDIFAQRSEDGGKTYGERIYLARSSETVNTVNNPVMAQDVNGRIHFLYCENYSVLGGRVLHRTSDDDGVSWSEPRDITASTLPEYRNAFALGPGHGICTPDGTLLFPVWMVPKCYGADVYSHRPSVINVLYSKDNGESWQMGDIMRGDSKEVNEPSETGLTLRSDGSVYLNARVNAHKRVTAYSKNGYCDFTTLTPDDALNDPICFGSCATYSKDGFHAILFANCDHLTERKNVTVKLSRDDGKRWKDFKIIDPHRGGYVECGVNNRTGDIFVLYEENWGKKCHLAVFDLEWLRSTDGITLK